MVFVKIKNISVKRCTTMSSFFHPFENKTKNWIRLICRRSQINEIMLLLNFFFGNCQISKAFTYLIKEFNSTVRYTELEWEVWCVDWQRIVNNRSQSRGRISINYGRFVSIYKFVRRRYTVSIFCFRSFQYVTPPLNEESTRQISRLRSRQQSFLFCLMSAQERLLSKIVQLSTGIPHAPLLWIIR